MSSVDGAQRRFPLIISPSKRNKAKIHINYAADDFSWEEGIDEEKDDEEKDEDYEDKRTVNDEMIRLRYRAYRSRRKERLVTPRSPQPKRRARVSSSSSSSSSAAASPAAPASAVVVVPANSIPVGPRLLQLEHLLQREVDRLTSEEIVSLASDGQLATGTGFRVPLGRATFDKHKLNAFVFCVPNLSKRGVVSYSPGIVSVPSSDLISFLGVDRQKLKGKGRVLGASTRWSAESQTQRGTSSWGQPKPQNQVRCFDWLQCRTPSSSKKRKR